jgi:ornithine cyclodeaminase/alanine dehydrogenase-like protein (mu-crystallin family)
MESITLFDSTGIAIEDMAAAQLIYRKAMLYGGYPLADMVERKA